MKRKLTMLLALVLIVAMFSTTALAGNNSWLFYDREYSWGNGYRVTKATEYWYGDETASKDPLEKTVYEFVYDKLGNELESTETITDLTTNEVYKYISRNVYGENGELLKYYSSEILPGETKEQIYNTAVLQHDEEGRIVKRFYYDGEEKAENLDTTYVYEYYGDSWEYTSQKEYWGTEKELAYEYKYEYNKDDMLIKETEVDHTEDTPVTRVTTYEYDKDGNLIKEVCGNRVITSNYDAQGRMTKQVVTVDGVVEYTDTNEYDANGNCIKCVSVSSDGSTDVYEYTHNERGQETTYSYNGELYIKHEYFGNGKLKVRDYIHWGETYGYNYDTNGNNNKLTLTRKDVDTGKTFVSAEVTIEYEADPGACWFDDVEVGSWYYAPVVWASNYGVTTGTGDGSTFSPTAECTRAQVVTFLYRAAGYPEINTTECPFVDVDLDTWYSEAVLWAVENGITTGVDSTHFAPDNKVSRSEFVTFLYRAAKAKAVDSENTFNDIAEGDWYYDAVLWAAENGITTGTGAGTFAPKGICSRAETVTFLYRYCG